MTTTPMEEEARAPAERGGFIRVIAAFKLCKAALLLALGFGAIRLLQPDVAAELQDWLEALATSSDNPIVLRLLPYAIGLTPHRLQVLSIAAFLYAALFIVEGIGLWMVKRWAEYLTVIATLSLVPFEVYALTRHVSLPKVAALVVNLGVVAYLIYRLRESPSAERA